MDGKTDLNLTAATNRLIAEKILETVSTATQESLASLIEEKAIAWGIMPDDPSLDLEDIYSLLYF